MQSRYDQHLQQKLTVHLDNIVCSNLQAPSIPIKPATFAQVPLESGAMETMIAARLSASTFLLSDILKLRGCSIQQLFNNAQAFDKALLDDRVRTVEPESK